MTAMWRSREELVHQVVALAADRMSRRAIARAVYNLIDRRHGRVSTAVTSNIALSDWGKYLGDATLTAAILDRLAMHALRIDIDGPSYRQHVAHERAAGRGAKRTERASAPHRDADGG